MPERETLRRARQDKRAGKSPSTQAGEFVREEIHHIREGKHGARSAKQAIAIGLSKARSAGVKLPAPPSSAKASTKRSAASASRRAKQGGRARSLKRSRAATRKLKREPRQRGVPRRVVASGKSGRPPPAAQRSPRRCEEGGTDQKTDSAPTGVVTLT